MTSETELARGMRVLTADGEDLGTVDELLHDHFRVTAPPRRDFWLRRVFIREFADDQVTLCILAKDLDCHHAADLTPADPSQAQAEETNMVAPVFQAFPAVNLTYDLARLQ